MRMIIILALLLIGSAAEAAVEPKYLTQWDGETRSNHRVKWRAENGRVIISYRFLERDHAFESNYSFRNCPRMQRFSDAFALSDLTPDEIRAAAQRAMARWAAVAMIDFVEAADVAEADLVIGAMPSEDKSGSGFASIRLERKRTSVTYAIEKAAICLSPNTRWLRGAGSGGKVFNLEMALSHELGHAIGLDHPGREGALMAYYKDEDQDPSLKPSDVIGAQTLYGARGVSRSAPAGH